MNREKSLINSLVQGNTRNHPIAVLARMPTIPGFAVGDTIFQADDKEELSMVLLRGNYYEFHRRRVISRPGQPIAYGQPGIEIGPEISREEAFRQARGGYDVYTPWKMDAYRLAQSLHAHTPHEHEAHGPLYFAHYHSGGPHLEIDPQREGRPKSLVGPGHIFFGDRSADSFSA